MGLFTHRPSGREDQNTWERSEQDFHLRAARGDEMSGPNRFGFDERENPKEEYHHGKDIRNLGFFKEQERQFTQSEDEEEWQERQSPINFVLISCIFVILCVVGWFGYRWAVKPTSGEPPLITAETTPFKVRPENPGGMVIPHQDKLIYGRIAPDQQQPVEHLLPAPEQPIAPPPPQQVQPQTFVDANGQVYYAYPAPQQPVAPQQQPMAPQQQPMAPQQQYPNQQAYTPQSGYSDYYDPAQGNSYPQGISSAPQQMPQQQATPLQPGMQAPQMQQQAIPAPPQQQGYSQQPGYAPLQTQQAPIVSPQQQLPTGPQQLGNQQPMPPLQQNVAPAAQPMAAQTNTPVNPAPKAQQNASTSDKDALNQLIEQEMGAPALKNPETREEQVTTKTKGQKSKALASPYKLQVATLDSKADAEKEAKRIRAIDKNLFGNKIISIDEITLNGTKKPSYRVIINGFETPNAATQFSNKLKIHKVKGIVLRQPT